MTAFKDKPAPERELSGHLLRTADEEALFREARRRQRRRWAVKSLIAALVLGGIVASVVLLTSSSHQARSIASQPGRDDMAAGSVVALKVAGSLAVASDGSLYLADIGSDRVLVRLANGRFRVVAGDGRVGFAGDGGPAVRAELSDVSDLAFAPNGELYIADGGRIRAINRDGVIQTVAGDGQGGAHPTVVSGTPAVTAQLGSDRLIPDHTTPLSIAFSPGGRLYIATGSQILRLTAEGRLDVVHNVITSGPLHGQPLNSLGPIAIDSHGDIDVGGLTEGWSIWQVQPGGAAHEVAFARGSGGTIAVLQRNPNGGIYGEDGGALVRVGANQLTPVYHFDHRVHGQNFPVTFFAFAPDGTVYADDETPDGGVDEHQQLIKLIGRHVTLLWQQANSFPG